MTTDNSLDMSVDCGAGGGISSSSNHFQGSAINSNSSSSAFHAVAPKSKTFAG